MPYNLPGWVDNATPINAANLGLINTAINAMAKSGHLTPTTVGGTGNAITVTMSPAPTWYTDCPIIVFKAVAANTGAVTLNPNGLGAIALVKQSNAVLVSNDIKNGDTIIAIFDTVNTVYVGANIGVGAGGSGGGITGGPVSGYGHVSNLKIVNNATTPNSKLDVSWDSCVLANSSDTLIEVIGGSVATLDFGVTGANGLDTGTFVASTWYYVWAISNGTLVNLLGSASATAPTMPGGYTYKRLIGAWRTDGSANFLRAYQYNSMVFFQAQQSVLSAGNATVFTSVGLSSFVPPIANIATLRIFASWAASGGGSYFTSDISADNANVLFQANSYQDPGGWSFADNAQIQVPLPVAQTTYYRVSNLNARANLWVCGFTLPL